MKARTPALPLNILVLATLSSLLSTPAYAYKRQYHFYLTYTLGYLCGLPDTTTIAWADHFTDVYPGSDPGAHPGEWADPSKITDRRLFHFPVTPKEPNVVRGSEIARALLEEVLAESTPDSVFFGLALHPYQDSWAHEGYGPRLGHALHGEAPDYPHRDLPRAMQMAEATWNVLDRWSVRTTGSACHLAWSKVAPMIEKLSATRFSNGDKLAEYWRGELKLLAGVDLGPNELETEALRKQFADRVAVIKKQKKSDYQKVFQDELTPLFQ